MTMIRVIIAVIVLLEISSFAVGNCDGSGNCYVSNIATGTGTGADWTNACTDFKGACDVSSISIRGTTIWVGGSPGNPVGPSYTTTAFSAPDSGTSPITIIAASAANHGTDTGWRRQFATAPVPIAGPITISTDYWIFNGQLRAGGGRTYHDFPIGYHLEVTNTNGAAHGAIQISGSHVTLAYLEVLGTEDSYSGTATDNGIYYSAGVTNEYVGYSWINNAGADLISASSGSNFIFEHNLFERNHVGLSTRSSQAINIGDITSLTIRYNDFRDITNAAIVTDGNADASSFTPHWYFYGNNIYWTTTVNSTGTNGLTAGIVNLTGETLNGGVIHVYNNTIAGINIAACTTTLTCKSSALNLNGTTAGTCAAHTRNCIGSSAPSGTVYNNLWWDPYAGANVTVNSAANPQWTPRGDYGEGICASTGCTNNGSFTVVGANDTNATTGNPFVKFDGTSNFNFKLTANTAAGLSISGWATTPLGCSGNCENIDPISTARGDNGVIDRGTFQNAARALISVGVQNPASGIHIGSTYQEISVCTWSSAPITDNCPDGAAPFIKQWNSLDKTIATVSNTGLVTAKSNHNTFLWLSYGGITTQNIIIIVTDGLGSEPFATLPTGIVRTGTPRAFADYDTTVFDSTFPTTYSLPTGGKTWAPRTSADFVSALNGSAPGDVIVLQAGTTYSTPGVFTMPAKTNPAHKWIYIISSAMAQLPPPGSRVSPSDAVNMPKLVETEVSSLLQAGAGADHWWVAGIELYSASTQGGNPHLTPPANNSSYAMINTAAADTPPSSMPDSITIDRCYIHGDALHDVPHAVTMNASHFALLGSYVNPARSYQAQAQAATAYFTPGPMKIINNLLSADGEDTLLGGAGGYSNVWVLRDVYVHHNTFWNDPARRAIGVTIAPGEPYFVANNFELKICQRCLIDGNLMQNSWVSSQGGGSILWNAGTGVNGPDAVISDITFSNNIMTGTLQGLFGEEFAGPGNGCDPAQYPCYYPGEERRINYFNNLYVMGYQGPPGGRAQFGSNSIAASVPRIMTDVVWQHNTFVGPYLTDHVYCDRAFYFNPLTGTNGPIDNPPSINMWILDNVACRQTQGNSSLQGTAFLNSFMSDPAAVPVGRRYYGNVMQVFTSQADKVQTWPAGNLATTSNFTYTNPSTGNYQLVSPILKGSDGYQSGINYSALIAHQPPPAGSLSISGTVSGSVSTGVAVSITGDATGTVFTDASGNYSFVGLAAGSYTVTPFQPGNTFSPMSITVTLTTGRSTGDNFKSAGH